MRQLIVSLVILIGSLASAARGEEKPVSFYKDLRPLFNSQCNACHKPDKNKGDLDMTTYAALIKGGKHGSPIVAGDADKSKLLEMVSGPDPDMPKDADPLKAEQISLIARWIKQGAKDDTPAAGSIVAEAPVYTTPPVIVSMAYSPDGNLLAVSGYREVLLHKPDGSALVGRLVGEAQRVESISFSKDGKILGIAGGSPAEFGSIQFWDPATQKLIKTYRVSQDSLYGLSFAPDGKSIGFGGADKVAYRMGAEDGKILLEFKAHADWVLSTCFTLDGKQMVSGSRDHALKLIDVETGRFVDDINNPLEGIVSFARHPKEERVLYGGDLGGARIYKISDNQGRTAGRNDTNLIQSFERQPAPVSAVAFSPDGAAVALGSVNEVRVYDTNDPAKKLYTLSGHQGAIYAVVYKPDGTQIATGGFDGSVRLWDAKTGNLVKQFVPVPLQAPASQPAVSPAPAASAAAK